MFTDKMNIK